VAGRGTYGCWGYFSGISLVTTVTGANRKRNVTGPDLIQIAGLHRLHDPGRRALTRYPEESVLGISAAGEDEPLVRLLPGLPR